MPLDHRTPIEAVSQDDLLRLIAAGEDERPTMDYKKAKSDAPGWQAEFRRDASAFANAAGGHIVIGVDEENGVPTQLCGLQLDKPDRAVNGLNEVLQSRVKPQIPGVQIRAVPLSSDRHAIVVRIPRSFAAPHQVGEFPNFEFWSRGPSGKVRMDIDALRIAFRLGETIGERIRGFRLERLARILARDMPANLQPNPMAVLHIVPMGALDPRASYDLSRADQVYGQLPSLNGSVLTWRYNLEGFVTIDGTDRRAPTGYVQLFRNGSIEAAGTELFIPSMHILHGLFEAKIRRALPAYLSLQQSLGATAPLVLMLSLVGAEGYTIVYESTIGYQQKLHPIDQEVVLLPVTVIEAFEETVDEFLLPVFDALWNTVGAPHSLNYDRDRKWIEPRR
jgi:hypothetical protein